LLCVKSAVGFLMCQWRIFVRLKVVWESEQWRLDARCATSLCTECPVCRVPAHCSVIAQKACIHRDLPWELPCSGAHL
jgi:hypothetical protein